jgi:histidinol-phosphatase
MNDVQCEAAARVEFARSAIAPRVRELTLKWFQSPQLKTERKADGSVVTPVDREAEQIVREMVGKEHPTDGFLGEEFGDTRKAPDTFRGWRWVVDPIDGTGSYVRGIPHWVLLIGIEHDAEPMAGLIDCPAVDETLHASKGAGTKWTLPNGDVQPAKTSDVHAAADAMIEIGPMLSFHRGEFGDIHQHLCLSTRRNRGWSDGYAFALLATGRVDAAINFGFHRWDLSACMAIIEEAGGKMTDWKGKRDLDSRHILASNGHIHAELMRMIGRA